MAYDITMYSKEVTNASKSALLEIVRTLESYTEYMVLSGGWAPYFILEQFGDAHNHCGSVDIDFVLKPVFINATKYKTIVELLKERGYEQGETPFEFKKRLDETHTSEIHFLAEPETIQEITGLTQIQADLQAITSKGSSALFKHNFTCTLTGELPLGGESTVNLKVADIVGCLLTKGLALKGRYKEKDPYDIYTVIKYYENGPRGSANQVKEHLGEKMLVESLETIRKKFENERSEGTYQAAYFGSVLLNK